MNPPDDVHLAADLTGVTVVVTTAEAYLVLVTVTIGAETVWVLVTVDVLRVTTDWTLLYRVTASGVEVVLVEMTAGKGVSMMIFIEDELK